MRKFFSISRKEIVVYAKHFSRIVSNTLRGKYRSIAKQMLPTKFDCDEEIFISVKYILFLWNIFYFSLKTYLFNCKKIK